MDGRKARSLKTREAIVDATIGLLDAGDLRPRAASIAARAGLSVRSVFQHFSDLEDLFVAVSDRQANRVAKLYAGTVYEGSLDDRVDTFVTQRTALYEVIAPVRRAAMLQEPFSRIVASRLELTRVLHRLDLERAFGAELDAARAAGDSVLLEALVSVSTFMAWDEMRSRAGLDVDAARAAMRRSVFSLLSTPVVPSDRATARAR